MQLTCHEPVSLYENICGRTAPPVGLLQQEKSPPNTANVLSLHVFRKLLPTLSHLFGNHDIKQLEGAMQFAVKILICSLMLFYY